jgi:hypothetical protein
LSENTIPVCTDGIEITSTIVNVSLESVFQVRMDPHSIGRLDPDPGGLKRAKMKREKNAVKRQK